MIELVVKFIHCWLYALLFAPKVPYVGSIGREPEVGGFPILFALAVTACGRRQGGVGGFAAGGIFCGGLPPFRWPLPDPPHRFAFGEGVLQLVVTFGSSFLGHRFNSLTNHEQGTVVIGDLALPGIQQGEAFFALNT